MTHVMWVLLIAFLGVDQGGLPTVHYEVRSVHMVESDCYNEAKDMMRAAKEAPKVDVQCLPVKHGMIW